MLFFLYFGIRNIGRESYFFCFEGDWERHRFLVNLFVRCKVIRGLDLCGFRFNTI